jgi:protein gp37
MNDIERKKHLYICGLAFPLRMPRVCPALRIFKIQMHAFDFFRIEPLIGAIGKLNLNGIDWVIAGGESGPGARPMDPKWVVDIRNQCIKAKVAFFFKQWGGRNPKSGGRLLEGREWNQFPMELPISPPRYEMRVSA